MTKNSIVKLIVAVVIPLLIGAVSGIFTERAIPTWYASLHQPSFNPPNWLFGPVWTVLYILMGISLYLIWRLPVSKERNMAIAAFAVQLLLNFGWSFLFFYFKAMDLALVEIVTLWVSIIVMIVVFYKIKPLAAYLNIPYILWVTFASILNAAYVTLN